MTNWTKEQLEAINKSGSNIIVSAGAGSGKTAVLSERVLRLVKEGTHVNEILVLTFTNAAAAEMKERIRNKIKDEGNLTNELELIDSAYITTFDSFALSILKKYHYILNISKNLKIIDGSLVEVLKNKYIDEIFDKLYEDKKFTSFITTFSVKDDKEIKQAILNISNKLELLIDKEDYLNNYINKNFNEVKIDNDINEYEELVFSKIDELKEYLKDLEAVSTKEYYDKVVESLKYMLEANKYEDLINLNIQIPPIPKDATDEVKAIKELINSLKNEIKELTTYKESELKEQILSTHDYVEVIIDVIKQLNNKINEYKFKNDVYEFHDIATLSIKILKENNEIREELKNSFKEILIDEYQDTSDIEEAFISLIENNNVYMVGDIKQSIYRFRNANPYIFKNKYDRYSNQENGIKIDLNKNFRSREEVLDDINLIFNDIMTDNKGGANYRESHNMIFGNTSFNEQGNNNQNNNIEIYEYDSNGIKKEEVEPLLIAKDIKNKIDNNYLVFDKGELRKITYNDFSILIDRTTDFDKYKEVFTSLNIPLVQIRDYKMNEEIDLYVIKNLLKLIYKVKMQEKDTEFTYLFMSIARSFLINMNDSDIYKVITEDKYEETELIKKIEHIKEEIDHLTSSTLIDKILKEFDYYNKIITTNNIEESMIKIDKIKEYALNLEGVGYSIKEFIDYLEELLESNLDLKYSQVDSADGVKIMTIHKSKGLEYHICYYPGLYKSFNISDLKDKFTYDNTYGIITPYFKEGIGNTIYKTLMKENYLKEEVSEKIRLFYVALTRAKEKMIIVRPVQDKAPNKINSFANLLYGLDSKLTKYVKYIEINKEENLFQNNSIIDMIPTNNKIIEEKTIVLDKKMLTKHKYSKDNLKINNQKTIENIEFGLKLHEEFELDDFKNPTSNYVKNFIKHFKLEDSINIIKEYEFIYEEEENESHGIIDLLIEYKDYIDIIDYKLKNIVDEAYLNQLAGYKKYIEHITNKKVNIYLYSILEDKLDRIET